MTLKPIPSEFPIYEENFLLLFISVNFILYLNKELGFFHSKNYELWSHRENKLKASLVPSRAKVLKDNIET